MQQKAPDTPDRSMGLGRGLSVMARFALKLPIHVYRWTLKPYLGWNCRHLPTCSEYALEAIETNGAWRGFWLMISRISRCRPWGTAGYDPVPDVRGQRYLLRPWLYGRWTGRHMARQWTGDGDATVPGSPCCGEHGSRLRYGDGDGTPPVSG